MVSNEHKGLPLELPKDILSQIEVVRARITGVQLAQSDMMAAFNGVLQVFALKVDALQKENAELKAKQDKA